MRMSIGKLRVSKRILCRGKLCGCECVWWILDVFMLIKRVRSEGVCVCERRNVHIAWQPNLDNSINTQFADIIFAI